MKFKEPQAVMMSIRPEWAKLIFEGKKTLDLRKTRPRYRHRGGQLYTPFMVFIYITGSQGVVGHFICDDISLVYPDRQQAFPLEFGIEGKVKIVGTVGRTSRSIVKTDEGYERFVPEFCLTENQIREYLGSDTGFGWHITDVCQYDKPKKLNDFGLKRPPQSWEYIYKDVF